MWAVPLVSGLSARFWFSRHCQTGSRTALTAEAATLSAARLLGAAGSVWRARPWTWVVCSSSAWSAGCNETASDL